MSASTPLPSTRVYAVQLLAMDPNNPTQLAGRLEHVLSGRRHDFDDGPALLACLAHEQLQVARASASLDPSLARRCAEPPPSDCNDSTPKATP